MGLGVGLAVGAGVGAGAAGSATAFAVEVGINRRCPSIIRLGFEIELNSTIAATVTPNRFAILSMVSPDCTMYSMEAGAAGVLAEPPPALGLGVGLGAGAGVGAGVGVGAGAGGIAAAGLPSEPLPDAKFGFIAVSFVISSAERGALGPEGIWLTK